MGLRLRLSGEGCRERLLALSDAFHESRFDPGSKRTPPVLADETGGPGMFWKRGWPKGKRYRASSDDQSRVLWPRGPLSRRCKAAPATQRGLCAMSQS